MRRRDFTVLFVVGMAIWPTHVHAQQSKKNTSDWRPPSGRTGIVVTPHKGVPRWI